MYEKNYLKYSLRVLSRESITQNTHREKRRDTLYSTLSTHRPQ